MDSSQYAYEQSRKVFKKKIQAHYGLDREITDEEMKAEITNLVRKSRAGTMDERAEALAATLNLRLPPFVI